jgi:hypothetical protein
VFDAGSNPACGMEVIDAGRMVWVIWLSRVRFSILTSSLVRSSQPKTLSASYEYVVQLERTSACEVEGRRFESDDALYIFITGG